MRVIVENAVTTKFPLTWNEILAKEGLYEDDQGEVVVMPRVKGSAYAVVRGGRLDISGHTVGEYNQNRSRRRYRLYDKAITLSN